MFRYILLITSLFFVCFKTSAAEKFWWGVSTSPYQTEDVGVDPQSEFFFKTDWDVFFDIGRIKEPKGNGVFSFTEYKRDIAKMKELGVSHYRFGIEWARVEPKKGKYNMEAIEHYKKIVQELKKNQIVPIICLWHWTFPDWGYDHTKPEIFGFMNSAVKERWPDFVRLIANEFKDHVDYYAPQNEPNAQSLAGFFLGIFPPGTKYSLGLFRSHIDSAADAFNVAAKIIKEAKPSLQIMSVQNMIMWDKAWWDITGYFYNLGQEFNFKHLDKIKDSIDILGFNYYYRIKASPFPNTRHIDADGMGQLMIQLSEKYKKPLLITENGWPDSTGDVKKDYMLQHTKVAMQLREKTGLIGYFYWSLVDNFEWSVGYKEKYGLYKYNSADRSLEPYSVALEFKKIIAADNYMNPKENNLKLEDKL